MNRQKQKGQVVLFTAFFVLIIMTGLALSINLLMLYRQRASTNSLKALQAYYVAESGIEDGLLKLNTNLFSPPFNYNMTINSVTVNVSVSSILQGERTIISQATNDNIVKTIQANFGIDKSKISFYYGVQVGAGGLQMSNGTDVLGNVFSNGSITGSGNGTSQSAIANDVIIATNGNSIDGVYVGGDTTVYSCTGSTSVDDLTYVVGGQHTCTVRGNTFTRNEEISPQNMPIPPEQITEWKTQAEAGQVIVCGGSPNPCDISGDVDLGPAKYVGNVNFGIGSIVTLDGTIYVTGTMTFQNNVTVRLNSAYGTLGGIMLADGNVTINNGDSFTGSGSEGSYVMVLSTSTADTAIDVNNNAEGVVLYAGSGGITIHNNVSVTEATGYKVILLNNAQVEYSSGLVNIYFSSGPGGAWNIIGWEET